MTALTGFCEFSKAFAGLALLYSESLKFNLRFVEISVRSVENTLC